jgi:hypothetical protein
MTRPLFRRVFYRTSKFDTTYRDILRSFAASPPRPLPEHLLPLLSRPDKKSNPEKTARDHAERWAASGLDLRAYFNENIERIDAREQGRGLKILVEAFERELKRPKRTEPLPSGIRIVDLVKY